MLPGVIENKLWVNGPNPGNSFALPNCTTPLWRVSVWLKCAHLSAVFKTDYAIDHNPLMTAVQPAITLVRHNFAFINPYWLLVVTFLSVMLLEKISRRICSTTYYLDGEESSHPVVPCTSPLLKIGIYFPPLLRNLPWSPGPFKGKQEWPPNDIIQLPQSSTHGRNPSDPMDVCVSSLNYCLTLSSLPKGKSSLLQIFPLGSWSCNCWRLVLPVET